MLTTSIPEWVRCTDSKSLNPAIIRKVQNSIEKV
jgi:hypothetical protein